MEGYLKLRGDGPFQRYALSLIKEIQVNRNIFFLKIQIKPLNSNLVFVLKKLFQIRL